MRPNPELSPYQRFILNKIIPDFSITNEFSLYKLIERAVSNKCILPSNNALIMETFYSLKEHLIDEGIVIEKNEMTSYMLTDEGKHLVVSQTIEAFTKWKRGRAKRSIVQRLLGGNADKLFFFKKKEPLMEYYE